MKIWKTDVAQVAGETLVRRSLHKGRGVVHGYSENMKRQLYPTSDVPRGFTRV
jgi:hypothetical protein